MGRPASGKWRAEPRSEPDSGNPTVRDRRGALGDVTHGEPRNPIRNRKSGLGHSSPTGARAQDLSRQPARPDLWGTRVRNDPGLPGRLLPGPLVAPEPRRRCRRGSCSRCAGRAKGRSLPGPVLGPVSRGSGSGGAGRAKGRSLSVMLARQVRGRGCKEEQGEDHRCEHEDS